MLVNFIGHVFRTVFCALQEQLASLDRHAQLTRCFSAVAELIVLLVLATLFFNDRGRKYQTLNGKKK